MADNDAAFEGYIENTVDPSPWMLVFTSIFCLSVMLIGVPLAVCFIIKRRKQLQATTAASSATEISTSTDKEPIEATFRTIVCSQAENLKILNLVIPYTASALTIATCNNICLIFVSQNIGTKPVAAYALVQILVDLTHGVLFGPIAACTTLCSHSFGSGNFFLAGQYVQLAITLYLMGSILIAFLWSFAMYHIVLFLQWGDEETAAYSQEFVRVYVWSIILKAVHDSIWQLLIVAGHVHKGTIVSIMYGLTNVLVVGLLVNSREANLTEVGLVFIGTALFYIMVTVLTGTVQGWFTPFWNGLLGAVALRNKTIVSLMLRQSLPLSFGSLISNAEWALFTFFASHLGPAEVAAWALLGSIWEIFYSIITGIGDAAEIRVAYHLGDNHPTMARLSAYKSLMVGMLVSCLVSVVYFSMSSQIPGWFTTDATLQGMLSQVVPFVGLANLTMAFGMQCWSIIGAQGKYRLATWISLVSSWGVSMPLAGIFVYVLRFNLQGVTSAVVIGYLSTGAVLSCVLLSTDWYQVACTVRLENAADALRASKILNDRTASGMVDEPASPNADRELPIVDASEAIPDESKTMPVLEGPDVSLALSGVPGASNGRDGCKAISIEADSETSLEMHSIHSNPHETKDAP